MVLELLSLGVELEETPHELLDLLLSEILEGLAKQIDHKGSDINLIVRWRIRD